MAINKKVQPKVQSNVKLKAQTKARSTAQPVIIEDDDNVDVYTLDYDNADLYSDSALNSKSKTDDTLTHEDLDEDVSGNDDEDTKAVDADEEGLQETVIETKANMNPVSKIKNHTNDEHISVTIFEKINNTFSKGKYAGFDVLLMNKNGYVNVTKMCDDIFEECKKIDKNKKLKRFRDWKALDSAKELIDAVSTKTGLSESELMITFQGGSTIGRGTYVHPDLVMPIKTWTSTSQKYVLFTHIYFITHDNITPIKIGKADDLKKRLSMLQVGSPVKLNVYKSIRIPQDHNFIEKCTHEYLESKHSHGEWFNITLQEADRIHEILSAKNYYLSNFTLEEKRLYGKIKEGLKKLKTN